MGRATNTTGWKFRKEFPAGRCLLTLALFFVAIAGARAAPSPRRGPGVSEVGFSSSTVRFVEYFLKTKTAELDAGRIDSFMRIVPETLPERLRAKTRAKQSELSALRKLAEMKRKPPIRRVGLEPINQCELQEGTNKQVKVLREMGFIQIEEDEERWLMEQTRCTECELMIEFSLTIIMVPAEKKGGDTLKYLFIHAKDPLAALLVRYRQGKSAHGTDFFSAGFAGACR